MPSDFTTISDGDSWSLDLSFSASATTEPCFGGSSFTCTGFTGLSGSLYLGSYQFDLSPTGPIVPDTDVDGNIVGHGTWGNAIRLLDGDGSDRLDFSLNVFDQPLMIDGRTINGFFIDLRGDGLVTTGNAGDVADWTLEDSSWAVANSVCLDCTSPPPIPIPAAVWLFGSALLGLGWVRRRQTA